MTIELATGWLLLISSVFVFFEVAVLILLCYRQARIAKILKGMIAAQNALVHTQTQVVVPTLSMLAEHHKNRVS